jgi:hypothetical protein
MIDNEQQNGNDPSQELPEIEVQAGEAGAARNIPGLGNLLIQPGGSGRGWWDPVERVMKGSSAPEDFLRLTNVTEAAVGRHQRIQYVKNLAHYGNGRLEDVMWSGYNLRCSVGGELLELIAQMVTGDRQRKNDTWQQRRQGVFNRARSNNPMGENAQRLNNAE